MKFTRKLLTGALGLVISLSTLTLTAQAAEQTATGIGFVTGDGLRLRSKPSADAQILDSAPKQDCVVVVGQEGEWYQVVYNLQEGYMHQDYLSVLSRENAELGYGEVQGSGVNLRSGPSTSHSVVGSANQGDRLYIIGLNDGWYKVLLDDQKAYIRSDFLALTEIPYENQESENSPKYYRHGKAIGSLPSSAPSHSQEDTPAATGQEILAEAQNYLGTPYVYGGASPSGFDCSGFVYYVLKQLGYSPYRTPADQFRQGSAVDKADLEVGDIVFFANTYASGISHVGIYAGSGQFIHSPNSRSTVSYSDLSSGYWADHYYGARRMG